MILYSFKAAVRRNAHIKGVWGVRREVSEEMVAGMCFHLPGVILCTIFVQSFFLSSFFFRWQFWLPGAMGTMRKGV